MQVRSGDSFDIEEVEQGKGVFIARPNMVWIYTKDHVEKTHEDVVGWVRDEAPSGANLIIDLDFVHSLSPAMLGQFILTKEALQEKGGKLYITSVPDSVTEAFRIHHLNEAFNVPDGKTADELARELLDKGLLSEAEQQGSIKPGNVKSSGEKKLTR